MDITDVGGMKAAKKRAEVAKAKAEKGAKAPSGSFSYKQYLDMKKKGSFKGFDGMKGQTGPEAKLKGK